MRITSVSRRIEGALPVDETIKLLGVSAGLTLVFGVKTGRFF